MTRTAGLGLGLLLLVVLAAPALAHVPAHPEENTSPARAVEVPDAVKSWSFYDRLGPGEVSYYRFTLLAGERLVAGTFTPTAGAATPSMVAMSPAFEGTTGVPDRLVVPDGWGAIVVEGARPAAASYEPFAPSANYPTASLDRRVDEDTTVLLAVYEPAGRPGPVGVTIGSAESFSLGEYLTVPFDLVRTHRWAGQSLPVAIGPFVLTLLVGAALLRRRGSVGLGASPVQVALAGAGLLVLASAVNTVVQLGLAGAQTGLDAGMLVTAGYVVVPALCGRWALRTATGARFLLTPLTRVGLLVAGIAAAATWAGFLLGPALLVGLAGLPQRWGPGGPNESAGA